MQCILGFDFGTQRIGVAVGQAITGTASPLTILPAQQGIPDWAEVKKIIGEWQPSHLIVGLPLNMDGSESDSSQLARRFAQQLTERSGLPTEIIDERLSSVAAEQLLDPRKKKPVDSLAAMIIVETWLAHQRNSSCP